LTRPCQNIAILSKPLILETLKKIKIFKFWSGTMIANYKAKKLKIKKKGGEVI